MLTTSKKPQFSYVRRLLVLPLIAALVCLFAFTVKTRNAENHVPAMALSKPFVLVVDAGHGGKDFGATGNGLYEKDATLKVAQKIKEFSPQYNIDVILTRNSDVFMNVPEKSNFANGHNADAFICIHVNSAPKIISKNNPPVDNPASGFEVVLSMDKENLASQNQALGSAILQNVSKDFNAASTLQTRNVGIWVLKNSNIPSALIECGYITNKDDADNLKDNAKVELMAKNILAGVAAYANNAVDKSNVYQLQKDDRLKDATQPILKLQTDAQPLYVLDGKTISKEEAMKIDGADIKTINILKDKFATDKYGAKAKDGAIEIVSKKDAPKKPQIIGGKMPENILYVLDGKVSTKAEISKIDPNNISSMNVWKGKDATDKYGEKGKDGVVEITSKQDADRKPPTVWKVPDNVLYVIDGKISDKEAYDKLNRKTIESMNVLKDKNATDKYGEKGKNGVIEITLKSKAATSLSPSSAKDTNFVDAAFPGGR